MTNQYKIYLTRKAHRDLRDIYHYIKDELLNKSSALKVIDNIEDGIRILKDYPKSGSPVKDEVLLKRGYRKLILDKYIALYTIDQQYKVVHIIRILYGKRDYLDFI